MEGWKSSMVHSNFERLIDLEGYSPGEETVSHHCSAVVLSRFGNQLEGASLATPSLSRRTQSFVGIGARHAGDRLKD
jgi:hypothetical protein